MPAVNELGIPTAQNFATIRAIPSLPSPEWVAVFAHGKTVVADVGVGMFYWSPTSAAADDDALVLRPTDRPSSNGRWLKL